MFRYARVCCITGSSSYVRLRESYLHPVKLKVLALASVV